MSLSFLSCLVSLVLNITSGESCRILVSKLSTVRSKIACVCITSCWSSDLGSIIGAHETNYIRTARQHSLVADVQLELAIESITLSVQVNGIVFRWTW